MTPVWGYIKTTVLGGLIFLLPIAATVVIIVKAGRMALDAASPLADKLPLPKGEAVIVIYILGAIALVVVAFAAGVYAKSLPIEKKVMPFLENRFLRKLPPYAAARKYAERLAGLEGNSDLQPVLVRFVNSWQVAFIVEKLDDSHIWVFAPHAPDAVSGSIHLVEKKDTSPLGASREQLLACLEKSGRGLSSFLS